MSQPPCEYYAGTCCIYNSCETHHDSGSVQFIRRHSHCTWQQPAGLTQQLIIESWSETVQNPVSPSACARWHPSVRCRCAVPAIWSWYSLLAFATKRCASCKAGGKLGCFCLTEKLAGIGSTRPEGKEHTQMVIFQWGKPGMNHRTYQIYHSFSTFDRCQVVRCK